MKVSSAHALREAFDRSFAVALPERAVDQLQLLRIRVRGRPYYVRLDELVTVHRLPSITPAPSSAPSFVGLGGMGGKVIGVHDLGHLLGEATERDTGSAAWILIPVADATAGLAFQAVEGVQIVAPAGGVPPDAPLVVRHPDDDEGGVVLDLTALVATLAGAPAAKEETAT